MLLGLASWLLISDNPGDVYIKRIAQNVEPEMLALRPNELNWYQNLNQKQQRQWAKKLLNALPNESWTDLSVETYPISLFKHFANLNHAYSQWLLANRTDNRFYKQYWLKKAAQQNKNRQVASQANWLLAKLLEAESATKAEYRYQQALSLSNQNRIRLDYAQFLIKQGRERLEWNHLLKQNPAANDFYHNDLTYYRESWSEVKLALINKRPSCARPVQLIANNYQQLIQQKLAFETLLKVKFFSLADFCIAGMHWHKNAAQLFNPMGQDDEAIQSYHWLVIKPELKRAYRQGPVIYTGEAINTQVLGHELAHWLGFEDEYQLSIAKAKQRCLPEASKFYKVLGNNVVALVPDYHFKSKQQYDLWLQETIPWSDFIDDPESWLIKTQDGYQIRIADQDEGTGFYLGNTCKNIDLITLKSVYKDTFMQNHAYHIPKLYRKILAQTGGLSEH